MSDLTVSQINLSGDLAALKKGDKGDKGDRGDKGDKGDTYVLPHATDTVLGGVIIGDNVNVDAYGKISTAMSAADKTKLDGIEAGAQVNILGQADKTKLDGITAGAQVNVIEHVSVNGNELTVSNKSVGFYEHLMRKNSMIYAVGDIAYMTTLPSWAYLECTTAGATASTEPTLSSVAVGTRVTDGTVTWLVGDTRIFGIIAANPNFYNRDALFTTAKTMLTTPATLMVNINNVGYALRSAQTINLALTASWDSDSTTYATAANRAGKDFYIYACVPTSGTVPTIVLSVNSTVPSGYTATNSRKIGGFHCLCADVGTISGHALSGYIAGDILPASAWDLLHRPKCDPEGMAYNAGTDMWNMIYLASWTGTTAANTLKLVSKFGAVTADGTSAEKFHWYKFADVMSQQNMRHPWHREFMAYARGSNQGTNINGSTDANTTGGHVDTAGRRMISNDGLEDCCGFLWQWIEDTGSVSTGSWTGAYDANDFSDIKGSSYTTPYKGLAGGDWGSSGYCGSHCSGWDHGALGLGGSVGARGASEPRKGVM